MLDIRLIRDKPDFVKGEIARLHTTAPIDEIVELDAKRRALLTEVEALKAERNEGSKAVSRAKDPTHRQELIENLRGIGDTIDALDAETRLIDEQLRDLLLRVPNLPLPEVPDGPDESANVVVREVGAPRRFDFQPRPHWEIAEELGLIDFERGVKVAGSRFYVMRGDAARLQRALITWMIDLHVNQHGYQEVYPPYFVLQEMLVGTGNLPKFGDVLFRDAYEDKWLIPTAEVPVTNLYRDEILDEELLPIYHVAYSACFRREQISAGRDVRGIKRGYQFDKVEMVKFVHPDRSIEEHDRLIGEAEDVLRALELPYRVLQMCTGDLSFTAANKVDLETWAPGSDEWLEVSSGSNFLDFQARRANLRFRPAGGGRPQFLHTLNGSGLALPRTVISIIENYQREDGSFEVPEVLRPYLGGQQVIGKQPPIGPAAPPAASVAESRSPTDAVVRHRD
jgi:seryl-tRNA synthetase